MSNETEIIKFLEENKTKMEKKEKNAKATIIKAYYAGKKTAYEDMLWYIKNKAILRKLH